MDHGTRDELISRLAEAIRPVRAAHPLRVATGFDNCSDRGGESGKLRPGDLCELGARGVHAVTALDPVCPAEGEEIGPAACVHAPDAPKEHDRQCDKEQSGEEPSHEGSSNRPREQAHDHTCHNDDSKAEVRGRQVGPDHFSQSLARRPHVRGIALPGRLRLSGRSLRPLFHHPPSSVRTDPNSTIIGRRNKAPDRGWGQKAGTKLSGGNRQRHSRSSWPDSHRWASSDFELRPVSGRRESGPTRSHHSFENSVAGRFASSKLVQREAAEVLTLTEIAGSSQWRV